MVEWFKAPVLKADVVYSYRGFESLLIQISIYQMFMFFNKLKFYSLTINRISFMLKLILICIFFNTIVNDYHTFLFIWSLRLSDVIAVFCGIDNEWAFLLEVVESFLGINILSLSIPRYIFSLLNYWLNYFWTLDFNGFFTIIDDPNPTSGFGTSNSGSDTNNSGSGAGNNNGANINQNNGVSASNNPVVNNGGPANNNVVVVNNDNNINADQDIIENLDPNDPLQNLMIRTGQVPAPRPNHNFDENDPNVLFDITTSIVNATEHMEDSEGEEEKEGEESD